MLLFLMKCSFFFNLLLCKIDDFPAGRFFSVRSQSPQFDLTGTEAPLQVVLPALAFAT